MEWLLWAGVLLLVIGWPVLLVMFSAIFRRARGMTGSPRHEYALKEHAETMARKEIRDMQSGGKG